jgi:hypothetical protein
LPVLSFDVVVVARSMILNCWNVSNDTHALTIQ